MVITSQTPPSTSIAWMAASRRRVRGGEGTTPGAPQIKPPRRDADDGRCDNDRRTRGRPFRASFGSTGSRPTRTIYGFSS